MATTEETEVKNYFREELERYAKVANLEWAVLPNSASSMTEIGRADTDVILDNVIYIHVEFKAADKALSLAQEVFFAEERYGAIQLTIAGKQQVDSFFANLPQTLAGIAPQITARIMVATSKVVTGHDKYLQNKQQRASAATKRPKRQSPGSNKNLH